MNDDRPAQNPATKTCNACGVPKPLSEYYRKSNGYYRSACRKCQSAKRGKSVAKVTTRKNKVCILCNNLAHRVEGANCERCGLEYMEEEPLSILDFAAPKKVVDSW